ncbi:MAG: patatin-like phospholipase family protein [Candidatus Edwardsbacteria bacterium]
MNKKKALVLSGGGAKGAYQVGAVDYLLNQAKLDFDIVTGVSVGSLNASMIVQGEFQILKDLWLNIKKNSDIYTHHFGGWLFSLIGKDSLYSNEPLWKLIDKYIDPKKIENSGKELRIGVVSLYTGEYYSINGRGEVPSPLLKKMILASTTIPIAFSPVSVTFHSREVDETMVDGGVRNITPLKEAIDLGAEEIFIILASPPKINPGKKKYKSLIKIGIRTLDILLNEIFINDLEIMQKKNELVTSGADVLGKWRYISFKLVQPESLMIDTLEFNPEKIRIAMSQGFADAEKVLENH